MGWFDFWKRKPKPAEPPAASASAARFTGPYTPEDFPCPNPTPGHAGAYSLHIGTGTGNDEVAFAVVIAHGTATEQELTLIGVQLRDWQTANDFVRRIIGLEQLLRGTFPETPTDWFFLPIPPLTERVALVLVTPAANNEQTGQSLNQALEGLPVYLCDPEYYSFINR